MVLENETPYEDADVYSENEVKFEVIRKTKCETKYADVFLKEMSRLGLGLCKEDKEEDDSDYSETYNLAKFSKLRDYTSKDEYDQIMQKRLKVREEIKKLEEAEKLAKKNSE